MARGMRVGIGALVALAALASLAALSWVPYTARPAAEAAIRLTWRARVPTVAECRRPTQEELDALPAHMRREEICEGRVASYRLEVVVDDSVHYRKRVSGAGARGDRPLYVFEEIRLPPGLHAVRVVFERIDPGATASREEPTSGAGATVPDRLVLEERLRLGAGEVVLVTYDAGRRSLRLVRGERPR